MSAYSSVLKKTFTNIVLYGFPVLYFLIAVGFYLKTYDSAQIKITLFQVGGLFLIGAWLIAKIENGNFDFFKKNFIFILPIIAFLFSGFFSFISSPFPYASLNEFTRRFIYCSFAIIIISEFNTEQRISTILNWLIAATYIACIYGIIQLADYHFFPPPPDSGLDPFLWRQAFGDRIFSTFGNPNFFGDFLVVMNPIILGLFLYKRSFHLIFLWVLLVVCAVFTLSKGTWLGFAVGTFVFIVIYLITFFREKLTKKMLISGAIAISVILCLVFFGIFAQTKKRTDSASFRIFTWLSAWEMINTHPILGTGIGSFYVTYPAWRRPQIFFIEGKHNTESDHPENEYLEVWFDEGIIGITIFLLLIGFVFVAGYKNIEFFHSGKGSRASPMPYIQLGVLAAFSAQLAHDAVCVSLRFVSSGVMLWLLVGLTLSICVNSSTFGQKKEEKEEEKNTRTVILKIICQITVIVLTFCCIKYFIGYFKADYLHSQAINFSKQSIWDKALKTYDAINKANPSFPMSRYFQVNTHLDRWKAGDPQLAERVFAQLWELAPNYVQSKYMAGSMYQKVLTGALEQRQHYLNGNNTEKVKEAEELAKISYELAVRYFNEYIALDPIFTMSYYQLADVYAKVGNLEMAEKTLKAHLEFPEKLSQYPHNIWVEDWTKRRYHDYSETYAQLGNLYLVNKQAEPAKNAYIKAIELNSHNINAVKNLANAYAMLGQTDKVKQAWMEVYAKSPQDVDAINYLKSVGVLKENKEK